MTLTNDPTPQRDVLIGELVDEMTAWSPRERLDAFRSWLKGSLSLVHLHVLTVVESGGPLPMSRLAETLDCSVASATGIVGRMEERGLVERHHGTADRRVVLVHPTETGKAVFRDMAAQRRAHLTTLLDRLKVDELAGLLTGLRAMRAARIELHAEMTASGLMAVTTKPAASTPPADTAAPTATEPAAPGHTAAPAAAPGDGA